MKENNDTLILYHFTTPDYLSSILQKGLTEGEIPLSPKFGLVGPSLTQEFNPEVLVSAKVLYPQKARVRITIEIRKDDPLLVPFRDLRSRFQHDADFMARLGRRGSRVREWFAYLGPISPERFGDIRVDGKNLTENDRALIIATWPCRSGVTLSSDYRSVTPEVAALSAEPIAPMVTINATAH